MNHIIAAFVFLSLSVVGIAFADNEELIADTRARAEAAMKKKDFDLARAELDTLLELAPKDLPALAQRAALRVLAGDSQGALRDLDALHGIDAEKALKLQFAIADRAIWVARKHMNDEEYREALPILDTILHLYPDSAPAYHDRGATKMSLKDYQGAVADLTRAIRNAGEGGHVADSYRLRAMAKRALGDYEGAKTDEKRRAEASAKALKAIETEQDEDANTEDSPE